MNTALSEGQKDTLLKHAATLLRASRYALKKPAMDHAGYLDSVGKLIAVIEGHRDAPSVEPKGPKSDTGSEFSQIPFETGGRNALNLQMLEQVRDTLKLMHKASLEKGNTAKSAEICNRSYAAFRDALELVNNSLQSAQAASDGKEQGTTTEAQLSGLRMYHKWAESELSLQALTIQRLEKQGVSSSSATMRGPMALLPCPFNCGTEPTILRNDELRWTALVRCDHCCIDWKTFDLWNQRLPSGIEGPAQSSLEKAINEGMRAEKLARRFHETYERLAPDFGYKTREASAKPWSEVPSQNKELMVAVCKELLSERDGQPESATGVPFQSETLNEGYSGTPFKHLVYHGNDIIADGLDYDQANGIAAAHNASLQRLAPPPLPDNGEAVQTKDLEE